MTAHLPTTRDFPSFCSHFPRARPSVCVYVASFLKEEVKKKKTRFFHRMCSPSAPLPLDLFGLGRDRRVTSYVLLSSVIGQSRPPLLPSAGRSQTHAWASPTPLPCPSPTSMSVWRHEGVGWGGRGGVARQTRLCV